MLVGPSDGPGEESFDVLVCTPGFLAREASQFGPRIGRHLLIVEAMDIANVKRFLEHQVSVLEAPSWSELASKIGQIGKWEFEEYRP